MRRLGKHIIIRDRLFVFDVGIHILNQMVWALFRTDCFDYRSGKDFDIRIQLMLAVVPQLHIDAMTRAACPPMCGVHCGG